MTLKQLTLPDLGIYSTIGRGLDADRVVALGEALVAQALVRGDVQACDVGWALQEFAREADDALEHREPRRNRVDLRCSKRRQCAAAAVEMSTIQA